VKKPAREHGGNPRQPARRQTPPPRYLDAFVRLARISPADTSESARCARCRRPAEAAGHRARDVIAWSYPPASTAAIRDNQRCTSTELTRSRRPPRRNRHPLPGPRDGGSRGIARGRPRARP
jgi:hypothetical protein